MVEDIPYQRILGYLHDNLSPLYLFPINIINPKGLIVNRKLTYIVPEVYKKNYCKAGAAYGIMKHWQTKNSGNSIIILPQRHN